MTYRGVVRPFSNRYYFSGGTPSDAGHWTTFSDAVVTAESAQYFAGGSGGATIIATFGYVAGSEIPVFSKTYSTAGTMALSGQVPPGDCAGVVRYSTAARSSKNHPIYLFSYYHTFSVTGAYPNIDNLSAASSSQAGTYATHWDSTGFSDGANTYKRSSPSGHDATGHIVLPQITHRDLPR